MTTSKAVRLAKLLAAAQIISALDLVGQIGRAIRTAGTDQPEHIEWLSQGLILAICDDPSAAMTHIESKLATLSQSLVIGLPQQNGLSNQILAFLDALGAADCLQVSLAVAQTAARQGYLTIQSVWRRNLTMQYYGQPSLETDKPERPVHRPLPVAQLLSQDGIVLAIEALDGQWPRLEHQARLRQAERLLCATQPGCICLYELDTGENRTDLAGTTTGHWAGGLAELPSALICDAAAAEQIGWIKDILVTCASWADRYWSDVSADERRLKAVFIVPPWRILLLEDPDRLSSFCTCTEQLRRRLERAVVALRRRTYKSDAEARQAEADLRRRFAACGLTWHSQVLATHEAYWPRGRRGEMNQTPGQRHVYCLEIDQPIIDEPAYEQLRRRTGSLYLITQTTEDQIHADDLTRISCRATHRSQDAVYNQVCLAANTWLVNRRRLRALNLLLHLALLVNACCGRIRAADGPGAVAADTRRPGAAARAAAHAAAAAPDSHESGLRPSHAADTDQIG
jgi:hypothetical protein